MRRLVLLACVAACGDNVPADVTIVTANWQDALGDFQSVGATVTLISEEFPSHTQPLGSLTGKHEHRFARRLGRSSSDCAETGASAGSPSRGNVGPQSD